ncbi:helix-turn-helix domain-containing protein [Liquorilactobacillus mali]|nr:helix-turn-helix domain-containing protein [Liquorilactobacillus mali]MDN7145640.1 helix-turn-helix domain-containing protein [Liquorilactobacillus mali]
MLRQEPPVPIAQIARMIGTSRSQIYRIKKFYNL